MGGRLSKPIALFIFTTKILMVYVKDIKAARYRGTKGIRSVENDLPENVYVRGRIYKIKWMKNFTREHITDTILKEGNDDKQSCMCAALMVLNGFWKIKFMYWIVWRFYYIKQYTENELTELLEMGKKSSARRILRKYRIALTELGCGMMMKKRKLLLP